MHPSHLIWDYNGTLVDDTRLCLEILNGFLERFGLPAQTYDTYRERFNFPLAGYYTDLGFNLGEEAFNALSVEFHQIYNARRFECPLHQGAQAQLQRFSGNGTRQHVLSAYREPDLREALTYYGIDGHFHNIVGQRNYRGESKAVLGQALRESLGSNGGPIILIGDTTHDFEVSQAMGAQCILMAGGHHPRSRLERCAGATVIDSLDELSAILA
ncbi:MAG: HAD family hydrolase [Opitutales bacterium]